MMATLTSKLYSKVASSHAFDEAALLRYAVTHVKGFPVKPNRLVVSQFCHGQSNPTFLLEVQEDAVDHHRVPIKRYVLRKKPTGTLLESAHAIEREFQVLKALGDHTDVPVPKVFCLCKDSSIIGTPFYIMEFLEGRIYLDSKLSGVAPETRTAIYQASARVLASLHRVNVDAIGLERYGRRENYCRRQVERWEGQYLLSTGEGKSSRNPKMLELANWLKDHVPFEDSDKAVAGLVHGDFRIDNLVFHLEEDRVIGILDWELSTVGNQMCDIAYCSMPYIVDTYSSGDGPCEGFEYIGKPEGIPSLPEYLAEYCLVSGKPWPVSEWKFYVAFSIFRGASILAGVYHRWTMGNASGGERAQLVGKKVHVMIDAAWTVINTQSLLPSKPPHGCTGPAISTSSQEHRCIDTKQLGKFVPSQRLLDLKSKLTNFMENHIYPMEKGFAEQAQSSSRWTTHPEEARLKEMAKAEGLWNLFIPLDSAARARKLLFDGNDSDVFKVGSDLLGAGLSNLEYGHLCEIMGRSLWAPQIFNCGAPDTGNMEVLLKYGTKDQMKKWLIPLLEGTIRSGFAMTEPKVASSDATNIECSIKRCGDTYIINGRKWWTSGAMDPRCKLLIVMGKTNFCAANHKQQSMVLVDINTAGVCVERPLMVFGFDDAPHGHAEVSFENVRVPVENILLGEGRGFEIAQGRLGPGRLHHCMRTIGAAERGMELMVRRALERKAFGKKIAEHDSFLSDLAKCRIELEGTRLLVLEAAHHLDLYGNKKARGILAMAKVAAPNMALRVLDMAMQVHGAAGLSSDTVLSHLWAAVRTLRIADGPDEVHLGTIAKLEIQRSRL